MKLQRIAMSVVAAITVSAWTFATAAGATSPTAPVPVNPNWNTTSTVYGATPIWKGSPYWWAQDLVLAGVLVLFVLARRWRRKRKSA
jgi:hypothetical protein